MHAASPDQTPQRPRVFWPGREGLLLSLALHAALIPLVGTAWISKAPKEVEPPAIEVSLVWMPPPADTEPVRPQAPQPPTPAPVAPPPPAPATAAPPPVAAETPAPPAMPRSKPATPRHKSVRSAPPATERPSSEAHRAAAGVAIPHPPPPAAAPAPPADARVVAAYSRSLFDRLDRYKVYPRSAQRRGEEGTVTVRLTLSKDGQVIAVVPLGGAPGSLVEASLAAVQAAAPFPPLPAELGAQEASFNVPIVYRLQ